MDPVSNIFCRSDLSQEKDNMKSPTVIARISNLGTKTRKSLRFCLCFAQKWPRAAGKGSLDKAVGKGSLDKVVAKGSLDKAVDKGSLDKAVGKDPLDKLLGQGCWQKRWQREVWGISINLPISLHFSYFYTLLDMSALLEDFLRILDIFFIFYVFLTYVYFFSPMSLYFIRFPIIIHLSSLFLIILLNFWRNVISLHISRWWQHVVNTFFKVVNISICLCILLHLATHFYTFPLDSSTFLHISLDFHNIFTTFLYISANLYTFHWYFQCTYTKLVAFLVISSYFYIFSRIAHIFLHILVYFYIVIVCFHIFLNVIGFLSISSYFFTFSTFSQHFCIFLQIFTHFIDIFNILTQSWLHFLLFLHISIYLYTLLTYFYICCYISTLLLYVSTYFSMFLPLHMHFLWFCAFCYLSQ